MKAYTNTTFQDRASQAAEAKQRKIEMLRKKPPVDRAAEEARVASQARREAAEAEKRANRKAAEEAAKQAALDEKKAAEDAEAERLAKIKPELTEEERKAARDARYAARKARR
jgi:hypothetical protein